MIATETLHLMLKRCDQYFLLDVIEVISPIGSYTADVTYEQFLEDRKRQDTVIRNIELGGDMAGMRDTTDPSVFWR